MKSVDFLNTIGFQFFNAKMTPVDRLRCLCYMHVIHW